MNEEWKMFWYWLLGDSLVNDRRHVSKRLTISFDGECSFF